MDVCRIITVVGTQNSMWRGPEEGAPAGTDFVFILFDRSCLLHSGPPIVSF